LEHRVVTHSYDRHPRHTASWKCEHSFRLSAQRNETETKHFQNCFSFVSLYVRFYTRRFMDTQLFGVASTKRRDGTVSPAQWPTSPHQSKLQPGEQTYALFPINDHSHLMGTRRAWVWLCAVHFNTKL